MKTLQSLHRMTHVVGLGCLLAVMLTGCGSFSEPQVMYKTKVIAASDTMLRDCPIVPPPAIQEYMAASVSDREKMLTDNLHAHITNEESCNKRLSAARSWTHRQVELYQKESPPH